jgi:hypothetical protein
LENLLEACAFNEGAGTWAGAGMLIIKVMHASAVVSRTARRWAARDRRIIRSSAKKSFPNIAHASWSG